jgi:hypothetical protein
MRGRLIKHGRLLFLILLAVLSLVLIVLPAAAGDGSGTGGGQDNPLALVSSNPSDGRKDVGLPVEIKLCFSKNVVHMTVRDNNRKCFSLYSADGTVPVEVVMADDQIEPEKKREVVLKPLGDLRSGAAYTVRVAPELQSKSGVFLGKQVEISFTTTGVPEGNASPGGDNANQNNLPKESKLLTGNTGTDKPALKSGNSATVSGEPAQAPPGGTANKSPPERTDGGATVEQGLQDGVSLPDYAQKPAQELSWIIGLVLGMALLGAIAYSFIKNR